MLIIMLLIRILKVRKNLLLVRKNLMPINIIKNLLVIISIIKNLYTIKKSYNEKIKEKNRILFALNNKKVNKFNRDNRKAYIKMVNRKWNKNIYNKNFFQSIKNNFIYNKIISKRRGDNLDNYFIYIFSELYSKKNIENIFN